MFYVFCLVKLKRNFYFLFHLISILPGKCLKIPNNNREVQEPRGDQKLRKGLVEGGPALFFTILCVRSVIWGKIGNMWLLLAEFRGFINRSIEETNCVHIFIPFLSCCDVRPFSIRIFFLGSRDSFPELFDRNLLLFLVQNMPTTKFPTNIGKRIVC